MIYACEDCSFLFYRAREVKECPSCEKNHIRPATRSEIEKLRKTIAAKQYILDEAQRAQAQGDGSRLLKKYPF